MNSTIPRGTGRIANRRRGYYSKAEASALGRGRREWLGLRAASAMPILPLLLLLILPVLVQAQFEYTVENGAVTITKYTGPGGDVVIPDTINELPVTSIGEYTFSGCTGLTSVTIPTSVTSIGDWAFEGCTGLTHVAIPDSVTNIGDLAFESCTSLTSVTIPDSVTSIGYALFCCCTSLTSVTIGNGVTSIGEFAFSGCTSLTSVTIPESVTSIGGWAFESCTSLTSAYFEGAPPRITSQGIIFDSGTTVYYFLGQPYWAASYGCSPTVGIVPELSLRLRICAGLTIIGEIGKVYSVEYVTDLTDPAESDWRCLEYLRLPASSYLWADKSAPATGKRFYRAVAMDAPTNMVFIPPGTFRMGSPTNEVDRRELEGPQTDVIISRGFWMGKYEVTQAEYLEVMGNNPSKFNGQQTDTWGYTIDYGVDLNRPVERGNVGAYCAALTERERLAGRIAPNSVYRLPTEAEWEYACRAGTSTRFSYGDDPGYANLTQYAWYGENSGGQTHPVGQKLPNPWGLYDMHGNVWELCQDYWAYNLPSGIAVDPKGPNDGWSGVFRGGGWGGWGAWSDAWLCRSAYRGYHEWESHPENFVGSRVVLAPGQP